MPAQHFFATSTGVGILGQVRIEAGRRAPFVQVPLQLLLDPDIDPFALATYIALKSWCDFGSNRGSHPSDSTAAQRCGMSRRTFIDRRQILRDKGWIEWRNGDDGVPTNSYIVHASLEDIAPPLPQSSNGGVQEMHRGCAPDAQGGVQEMHTTYIHLTETSIPKTREEDLRNFLPQLDELWGFWEQWRARVLDIRNPVSQKATWKRVRNVLDRLAEGYQVSDLKEAILGCCHRDHNVQGGYLDIELICRDQAHVDLYVHHWRSTKRKGQSPSTDQTARTLKAMYG